MLRRSIGLALVGLALAVSLAGPASGGSGAVLKTGSSGARVAALQRALNSDGYLAGPVDGHFGPKTEQAVIAFEKVQGLAREGGVPAGEYAAILRATRPKAPLRRSGRYLYVDLSRQVLFEVRGGTVRDTLPVSSGGGYSYVENGVTQVAKTPTGRFSIYDKIAGWRHDPLGWLYYPSYFTGGYAIHGDTYVPPSPVSHGCIRIPIWDAVPFYNRNPIGTPVYVEP
jgi:N-acetylmuramoyl-L-alanine amidase